MGQPALIDDLIFLLDVRCIFLCMHGVCAEDGQRQLKSASGGIVAKAGGTKGRIRRSECRLILELLTILLWVCTPLNRGRGGGAPRTSFRHF